MSPDISAASPISTVELVDRWDRQQAAYIASREARFDAMLDALDLSCADDVTLVDLACGPGSLTARVLRRFPRMRVIAVDYDPMLLAVAREYLAEFGDRVRVVDADLIDSEWTESVFSTQTPVHAAVSTTALHWLHPDQLVVLYRQLASALAPGGVFLNGDHFRFDAGSGDIRAWAAEHDEATQRRDHVSGADTWDDWWQLLAAHRPAAAHRDERERRFADRGAPPPTTVQFQLAALRQGGFTQSGTIWQLFDDYVVYGVTADQT